MGAACSHSKIRNPCQVLGGVLHLGIGFHYVVRDRVPLRSLLCLELLRTSFCSVEDIAEDIALQLTMAMNNQHCLSLFARLVSLGSGFTPIA